MVLLHISAGTFLAITSLLSDLALATPRANHAPAHQHLHHRREAVVDVNNPPAFQVAPSASKAIQALAAEASKGPDPIPAGAPPPLKSKSKAKPKPKPAATKPKAAPAPKPAPEPVDQPKEPYAPEDKPASVPKKAKAPTVAHSSLLGYVTDKAFNPATYRDGGGGGCINGHCVLGFSDSYTCSSCHHLTPATGGEEAVTEACKKANSPHGFASFVHNSFAVIPCAAKLGKKSPAKAIHDFGNVGQGNSNFSKAVLGPVTSKEETLGPNFAIWPNSNLVSLPTGIKKNQLVGVYGAVTLNDGKPADLYTTLATIDVENPKDIPHGETLKGQRIVKKLHKPHQPQYGKFALLSSHTIPTYHKKTPYLYLFATVADHPKKGQSSLKVARVPAKNLKDKKAYEYWCGASKGWSKQIPEKKDAASDVFVWEDGKLDTGEIFYSKHHQSLVLIFQKLGTFYVSTIADNKFTDPKAYSAPEKFFAAAQPAPKDGGKAKKPDLVYAGHVYPGWDTTGKKLLISWAENTNWVGLATVQWA